MDFYEKNAEQDAQIEAIQEKEAQYKNGQISLEQLVAFWNDTWRNGGLKFNGITMHFRAVDLNIKIGDNDQAWRILNLIYISHPEYSEKVYRYRYKIMRKEKKYMAALEHLAYWYSAGRAFTRADFISKAQKDIEKINLVNEHTAFEVATRLADIAESGRDIHAGIKKYFQEIGWL